MGSVGIEADYYIFTKSVHLCRIHYHERRCEDIRGLNAESGKHTRGVSEILIHPGIHLIERFRGGSVEGEIGKSRYVRRGGERQNLGGDRINACRWDDIATERHAGGGIQNGGRMQRGVREYALAVIERGDRRALSGRNDAAITFI